MKLPWDKKYLKISFHIIFTLILVYALKICIDFIAYVLANLGEICSGLKSIIGWLISVFSVVIIAFIISYLLEPLVEFLQNKYDYISEKYISPYLMENEFLKKVILKRREKKANSQFRKRTAGTTITYILLFLIIAVISGMIVNKISKSGGNNIIDSVMLLINDTINDFVVTYKRLEGLLRKYGLYEYISEYVTVFINTFTGFVRNVGNGIVGIIASFGGGLVNTLISIVIAFYFLKDKESIKHKFIEAGDIFLPKKFNIPLKNILGDIHAVFSGYIRGQLLDASIMAVLIGGALSIIGVDFAVIIGVISGFSNLIPYFGAIMGFVLAISVSILSGEPMKAVYATIVMLVLQQVDSIFIGPKVVGESVELSPVLVLIALAVAGELFGLWGMILAVPVFATFKMFMGRYAARRRAEKECTEAE